MVNFAKGLSSPRFLDNLRTKNVTFEYRNLGFDLLRDGLDYLSPEYCISLEGKWTGMVLSGPGDGEEEPIEILVILRGDLPANVITCSRAPGSFT